MSNPVLLDRVLCLPAPDIAALLQGRLITVLPKVAVQPGWVFALYPHPGSSVQMPIEQQYRHHFLSSLGTTIASSCGTVKILAWAKCEHRKMIHEPDQLDKLSNLTIWTRDALEKAFHERGHLFLTFLRVYYLPELIEVDSNLVLSEKVGKFIGLSTLGNQFLKPIKIAQFSPVLNEQVFAQKKQIVDELSPFHSDLEDFCDVISKISTDPKSHELENDIRTFLGWVTKANISLPDSTLDWVRTISEVGNSSDGNTFEKLVRKSLIELKFSNSSNNPKASLDPDATGGAGGIDVYCDAPYPLVGECKASKHESVPNSVSAQLIHLGTTHLGRQQFEQSIKVIFAAGSLTDPAEKAAVQNQMNVIRPETLQRLVELKTKHPGSIDLLDLKPCLEQSPFGEASDQKINRYIDQVWQKLKMRSDIIEAVKRLSEPERKQFEVTEIRTYYNALFAQNHGGNLDNQTVHELLIELSSPLAGYLGRIKGVSLQSDRFYFLRDLTIIEN